MRATINMELTFRYTGKNGIRHAFVVEFATKEDRDCYVEKDPVHQEFIRGLDGLIEKARVIDFTDRVF
jgi:Stress responsive A/B Barrel Domain